MLLTVSVCEAYLLRNYIKDSIGQKLFSACTGKGGGGVLMGYQYMSLNL